jgi:hypothetical protein
MKLIVTLLVVLLVFAHQDFWNWNSDKLFFEFLPIGLAYHMMISVAAAFVWFIACTFAWPKTLEHLDELTEEGGEA